MAQQASYANVGSKFKNGPSIVSLGPPLMFLIYKHKRGCTNEKNACTNNALVILRDAILYEYIAPELFLLLMT